MSLIIGRAQYDRDYRQERAPVGKRLRPGDWVWYPAIQQYHTSRPLHPSYLTESRVQESIRTRRDLKGAGYFISTIQDRVVSLRPASRSTR